MIIALFTIFVATASPDWTVRGSKLSKDSIDSALLFQSAEPGWAQGTIETNAKELGRQAHFALRYLDELHSRDSKGVHAGLFKKLGVDIRDVEAALAIVAFTAHSHPDLLSSPSWWERHFDLLQWRPDTVKASMAKKDNIRLTKYVVYEYSACRQKTQACPHALWAVPLEEDLKEPTEQNEKTFLRYRLTRQDILAGALEKRHAGVAEPLAWVAEETLFEAMMQGTIALRFSDGATQLFNVHRHNGMPYLRGRSHRQQQRYWYFRPVDAVYGWGEEKKIRLFPYVALAGDVENLGLGKLFWLKNDKTVRLAILADTGGAFQPNLGQLDWFVGQWSSKAAYQKGVSHLPGYVKAGVLIPKPFGSKQR